MNKHFFYQLLLCALLLSIAVPSFSQNCTDQFAGNVSFSNFIGESNDIWGDPDLDTIYLCSEDQFDLTIANSNLSGDPDQSTAAGVGYALYQGQPTISGPDLASISLDTIYSIDGNIFVKTGCDISGNQTFHNSGSIQDSLSAGGPVCIWYAPITYDRLDSVDCSAQYENNGSCVHANIDEAFPVVYLNPITVSDLLNNPNSGCEGSFIITGGLPEYISNSTYHIEIAKVNEPYKKAFVPSIGFHHNDKVYFSIREAGTYKIDISDGKSCSFSTTIEMAGCPTIAIDIPDTIGNVEDIICLPVTVRDFTNIAAMEFTINWDSTILVFDTILDSQDLSGFYNLGSANRLVYLWASSSAVTLDDYSTIFTLCYKIIDEGTSPVYIGPNINGIGISDPDFNLLTLSYSSKSGLVTTFPVQTNDQELTHFDILPNPATSTISIQSPQVIHQIHIFNQLGQLVLSGKSTLIDISFLPQGIYSVQVNMGEKIGIEKLVIE